MANMKQRLSFLSSRLIYETFLQPSSQDTPSEHSMLGGEGNHWEGLAGAWKENQDGFTEDRTLN
jgi:hypothetical protein